MIKNKIRTLLLVLLVLTFMLTAALFAVNLIGKSAYAEETEQAITNVSVKIDDGIRVLYTVELPDGYSEPTLKIERGTHTVTLKFYEQEGESIVFSYGGIRADVIDEEIHATLIAAINGEQVTVDENDFIVSDYFVDLFGKTAQELGVRSTYAYLANKAYAANVLNLGDIATGESLWEVNQTYVFTDKNDYNGNDWPLRDSLTTVEGQNVDGFDWVLVPSYAANGHYGLPEFDLNQGFYLRYRFTAPNSIANDLRVKIDFLGETHWTIPVRTGEIGGVPEYGFGVGFSVTEFSFDAQVTVYSGETPISATVGYNMNRALAYGATFGDNRTKALASAVWALGKAAVWYEYADEMEYVFLPSMTGNDYNVGFMYGYVYDGNYMRVQNAQSKDSPAIWAAGAAYSASELSEPVRKAGYAVSYKEDTFTVSLNGVQDAAGIVAPNGDVNVVVTADSSVSGGYFRNQSDMSSRIVSTVGATGNIRIHGENGATLTVNGPILAGGNVAVSGDVHVVVLVDKNSRNGVEANSVTLTNGASLEVCYIGVDEAANVGVRTTANVSVTEASLTVKGFLNGLQFGGNQGNLEVDFVVDNSEVTIESVEYAITAVEIPGADWNGWQGTRWTVTLTLDNGSVMTTDGNRGTRFVNVVLGDASLTVNAIYNGIGDEWAPATLTTTSGDYHIGTLNVIVTNTNTGAYAIVASAMEVNGGTLNFISGNMDGVIRTASGSVWNLDNCDIVVRTTSVSTPVENWDGTISIARTHGIQAESGDEHINIKAGATLVIKDCDIGIRCWLPLEYFTPVLVTVHGYLQIDNFLATQNIWDWGLTAQFEGKDGADAVIHYTNQRYEDGQ